jgi:hypothetical protein
MTLDEAKCYLGNRWVLSPNYRRQAQHSAHRGADIGKTIRRAMAQRKPKATNVVSLGYKRTGSGG